MNDQHTAITCISSYLIEALILWYS